MQRLDKIASRVKLQSILMTINCIIIGTIIISADRIEDVVYDATGVSIDVSKPVIYLYPEEKEEIQVKLDLDYDLTCTYPEYNLTNGWDVIADVDGTLTDKSGKEYNYLYWEAQTDKPFNFDTGFCIKGEETVEFLEWALEKQGLNDREANEFIVYWLPRMQENEYNVISFQKENYTESARLDINPKPDTEIRVYMAYYGVNEYKEIEEQYLDTPIRNGFTVVEWGGTELNLDKQLME